MNLHTDRQARQSGGRFGAKLAPPTVEELLANPPPGINAARFVPIPGGQHVEPNAEYLSALAWFEAITDAGGTPADLDRAREIWQPTALPGENYPKRLARDRFDELKRRAWRQTHVAPQRPEGFQHMEAVAHARWLLEQAEANLVPVEAKYLAFKAEVDRAQARLAAAEDAVKVTENNADGR